MAPCRSIQNTSSNIHGCSSVRLSKQWQPLFRGCSYQNHDLKTLCSFRTVFFTSIPENRLVLEIYNAVEAASFLPSQTFLPYTKMDSCWAHVVLFKVPYPYPHVFSSLRLPKQQRFSQCRIYPETLQQHRNVCFQAFSYLLHQKHAFAVKSWTHEVDGSDCWSVFTSLKQIQSFRMVLRRFKNVSDDDMTEIGERQQSKNRAALEYGEN